MQPKTTSSRGWRRGWAGIRGAGRRGSAAGDGRGFKPRGAHGSAKVGFEPGRVLRADRAGVAEQLAAWRLKPARERGQVLCTAAQVLAANLHQRRKGRGRGGGALGELMHQASIRLGGTHDGRTHVKALHLSREPQVYRVAVRRRQGSRAARHVQLGEGGGEVGRRPVWDHGRRSRGLLRRSRRGRPLSRSRWAAHGFQWSGRRHCRGHWSLGHRRRWRGRGIGRVCSGSRRPLEDCDDC